MSRTSQLPPRCPLQKKSIGHSTVEPSSSNLHRRNECGTRHHKSLSQSSMLEDQPAWLDDLLNDSDLIPKGRIHHRSASDSGTFFDGLLPKMLLTGSNQEEHLRPVEDGNSLEASCVYGPNSPREKSSVEFSDNPMLLAFSDYVVESPEQFVENTSWRSNTAHLDKNRDHYGSFNNFNSEPNSGKRHPCQRSRARKLQYIAELERAVNVFEVMESELAVRVSALLQQRVVLSLENNKLKQQLASLHKQKLIMDDEYQTLQTEVDMLKLGLANSLTSKICKFADSSNSGAVDIPWQTLDWSKLRL